jgi:hypothetical protein
MTCAFSLSMAQTKKRSGQPARYVAPREHGGYKEKRRERRNNHGG